MRILEDIADRPKKFAELIDSMKSNKATIHRFVTTLENLGYIQKNEQDCYQITQKVHSLGMKGFFQVHLIEIIKPYLKDLANEINESTFITSYSNDKVYYLEKIESPSTLRIVVNPGESAPLYCTASGKLYLAHLSENELEAYFERQQLMPITENTILNKEKLKSELAIIRHQGYAIDNEEWQQYLRGVAFPIYNYLNQIKGSLSIAGVSYRFTDDKIASVVPKAFELSKKITNLLGNAEKGY